MAVTESDRIEATGSIFPWIMGNAEAKVILLKSILLLAQEREMRISCQVLLSLLLRSGSEMHRGAGAVMPMSVEARQGGWCSPPAGQRAGLSVPRSSRRVVRRTQTSWGEWRGRWSAGPVSKELPPSALAPAMPPGTAGPGERVPALGVMGEESGWSQGGGLQGGLLCLSLPLAA